MVAADQLILRTCIFLLICCTNFLNASEEECKNNTTLYVIRSKGPNGLVLDGTEPDQVRVQHFTGSEAQLWKFEPGVRPGSYFLVNEYHGKVLDFDLRDDGHLHAFLSERNKCLQQQWNYSVKSHLVNVAIGKNVDIHKANFTPGNQVIIWEDNGCNCQNFLLQKKV